MVIGYHRTRILAQPFHTLLDDAVGLANLLNSYQIPIIAIAIDADRYIKIHAGHTLRKAASSANPIPRQNHATSDR